jgi:hypothetical protein
MKYSLVYLVLLLAVIGQPVGAQDFTHRAASALLQITDDMPRETFAKTLHDYCVAMSFVLPVRRVKAALSSGCKSHPAIAPAGSNRSSYGGNEVAEAFG